MWYGNLRSTGPKGVYDWVIRGKLPTIGSGCHHLAGLGSASGGGKHEAHLDLEQGWRSGD